MDHQGHFEWGLLSRCLGGGVAVRECRAHADDAVNCLSPSVRNLLLHPHLEADGSALDDKGLIVWPMMPELLQTEQESCIFLLKIARFLKSRPPVIDDEKLLVLDLHKDGVLLNAWKNVHQNVVGGALLALSHLEAFVKQHLPLHWSKDRRASVPHRLSDLVVHESFVSSIPSVIRKWFTIVMGPPPANLNLRNIFWHGFVAPHEVGLELTYFIFSFSVSVACLLGHPQAPFVPICGEILLRRPAGIVLEGPDVGRKWKKAVKKSFFIFPGMRKLLLQEETSICVKLVVLEQSVRQVFAYAIHRKERILTAELDCMMTTLDSMLANEQLHLWLGKDIVEQMLDLFVRESGPKLRDLISHGVLSTGHLPAPFVNSVCALLVRCCQRFTIGGKPFNGVIPYRSVYSPEVLAARAWTRLLQLFEALIVKKVACELLCVQSLLPSSNHPPANCNRRIIQSISDLGLGLLRLEAPAFMIVAASAVVRSPNEKLAQVLLKTLERNEISRFMLIVSCYVGIDVAQDRIAKRERSLFENKCWN